MPTVPRSPLCRHLRGRFTGCLSNKIGSGGVFWG
jgi:hypothetical protein